MVRAADQLHRNSSPVIKNRRSMIMMNTMSEFGIPHSCLLSSRAAVLLEEEENRKPGER